MSHEVGVYHLCIGDLEHTSLGYQGSSVPNLTSSLAVETSSVQKYDSLGSYANKYDENFKLYNGLLFSQKSGSR